MEQNTVERRLIIGMVTVVENILLCTGTNFAPVLFSNPGRLGSLLAN